jgi:hypothetical protein
VIHFHAVRNWLNLNDFHVKIRAMKALATRLVILGLFQSAACLASPQGFNCGFQGGITVTSQVAAGYAPMRFLENVLLQNDETTLLRRTQIGEPVAANANSPAILKQMPNRVWLTLTLDRDANRLYLVGLPASHLSAYRQRSDSLKKVRLEATLLRFEGGQFQGKIDGACMFR